MGFLSSILIIAGLALFEVINSIDNAIINAEVLGTMQEKYRKWFLTWGLFFAVVLVRGLMPWLIVYITIPQLGPIGALTATFSADPKIESAVQQSAPLFLLSGGVFLIFLFFHWLFMEPKNYGLRGERFFHSQSVWFYAVVSLILLTITWFSIKENPAMAFAAMIGSTAFFIIHGFKESAAQEEKKLLSDGRSDISKLLYLEAIDSCFSVDGVLGAFAFTLSVVLILIGNGLGVIVLRQITVSNIERIKRYKYLKNGAMYSLLLLGLIMLAHSFGYEIPNWVSPISTFAIVGYFFYKSTKEMKSIRA
jgi:hypothetical protein